jgi:hypothetical protein
MILDSKLIDVDTYMEALDLAQIILVSMMFTSSVFRLSHGSSGGKDPGSAIRTIL